MYRLTFLFSMLIALNASAKINNNTDDLNSEKSRLEKILFNNTENLSSATVDINAIVLIELEEEVDLGYNTANYLPENFNALKGKYDLDWNTIELEKDLPNELILELIDHSYDLVVNGLTRKLKKELDNL